MENISHRKAIAKLFNKIYKQIKNPQNLDKDLLSQILFDLSLYNMDLGYETEFDKNFNKVNTDYTYRDYDDEIKIYLANNLLDLSKKLPIPLSIPEGYYASNSDLEMGYKSYLLEEGTDLEVFNEKIASINLMLDDWLMAQSEINNFFWNEDENFVVIIPQKSEEVEIGEPNKITVEALVLLLKYLDKLNLIPLHKISQDDTVKANLFSILTGFSAHTLRKAFGKSVDKLNTPANLKKLNILLDNQSFQSNFKSVYDLFSVDYGKIL